MHDWYKKIGKRILELVLSVFGLTILSPVLLIASILIVFTTGFPIVFFQERIGKDCRTFRIFKFRTMNKLQNFTECGLEDYKRITKIGRALRTYSLDEIPQLINVILGKMSLVGPRPLLPEYLPLYNDFQLRRHEVRPGITGWAQVNGRRSIGWQEQFEFDVWYVDNVSLSLDIKIIIRTIKQLLVGDSQDMESKRSFKFKGN